MSQNLASRLRAEGRDFLFSRSRLTALLRRLAVTEPLLRHSVPFLMLIFITSLGASLFLHLFQERDEALTTARLDMIATTATLAADLAANPLSSETRRAADHFAAKAGKLGERWRIGDGRVYLLIDGGGYILSSTAPEIYPLDSPLVSHLDGIAASLRLGEVSGVREVMTPAGTSLMIAAHLLPKPLGAVVEIQPVARALAAWRNLAVMHVSLFLVTSFVILMLGFAFHWQSVKAREADIISDRMRARLDLALDRGRCGLWDCDLKRGRVYWSTSMYDILGLPPRDSALLLHEISDMLHEGDRSFLDDITASITTHRPVDREIRLAHAKGGWVWVRTRAEVTLAKSDGSLHLIGVALDVTEQRLLADQRNQADMRLRAALDSINEAFVLWDADNRLVLCNAKFQEQHALPDEAVLPGARYDDVIAAGRRPVLIRTSRDGKHRARTSIAELLGRNRDAYLLDASTETPLPSLRPEEAMQNTDEAASTFEALLEDGRWLNVSEKRTRDGGFVSVASDITALKHNEETLTHSDKRLRKIVEDLTSSRRALELQTRRLTEVAGKYAEEKQRADKAKRKAEAANHAKSEFLANISHELRTPLNAILGFSEVMRSGLFGPLGSNRYVDYCNGIYRSGAHLLGVIDDILDMSKLEAGKRTIHWEKIAIDELAGDVLHTIDEQARAAGITLKAVEASSLVINGDRRALKQILLNLVSNAVKFTPAEGEVSLTIGRIDERVAISIRDTGIGIAAAMIEKLGQPFVQVENQYTKFHKGSGLGLAISRSLAAMHGGDLVISSAPGHGTTATLMLPAHLVVS